MPTKEKRFLCKYTDQRRLYDEYRTADTDLKNQLLAVFDKPYLVTLINGYTGYTTRSTMELLKISTKTTPAYPHQKWRPMMKESERHTTLRSRSRASSRGSTSARTSRRQPESPSQRPNYSTSHTDWWLRQASKLKTLGPGGTRMKNPGQHFRPTSLRHRPTSGRGRKPHARASTEPTTLWTSRKPSQTSLRRRQMIGRK